jgi:SAM-dependent methyltransferase
MQAFLKKARLEGFETAEKTFWENEKQRTYSHQWDRASFHFFLPISSNATVLDLGSGYGNNTIPLARYYDRVVAADATRELLEYTSLRAQTEGLTNIDFVNIDPLEFLNLPFEPGSFDAIIMSGLLEWVGSAKLETPPNVSQQRVLAYLRTLLKKDGVLYVGIENRWFPGFYLRDPHTKIPYTCILPRPLANRYALSHGFKDGYRTYVYSSWGYKKMLTEAGFTQVEFHYPQPNYRNPATIFSNQPEVKGYLYGKGHLKDFFTQRWTMLLKILNVFRLHTFFLSSFMMIASSESIDRTPSILRRAVAEGLPGVGPRDVVMRVSDQSHPERCKFLVFRPGEATPYGYLFATHNPRTKDEQHLTFVSA